MATEPPTDGGLTDSFVLGIAFLVFAAALLAAGIELVVTCATTIISTRFGSNTVGCSYPFQEWGSVFFYFAAILTLLSFHAFLRDRNLRGRKWTAEWSPTAVSAMAGLIATVLLGIALLLGE